MNQILWCIYKEYIYDVYNIRNISWNLYFSYGPGFTVAITLRGHTSFVSSVCTLHPFQNYPDGLIMTGGCDNIICAFYPDVEDPIFILQGHKDNGVYEYAYCYQCITFKLHGLEPCYFCELSSKCIFYINVVE